MAGARNCHSFCRNPPPGGEDEPAGGSPGSPTKDSNTPTPSPPVSWAQTPVLTPAPPPVPSFTKELYHQLLKTYAATVKLLEQNHGSGPWKQPLKARFPDLYYGNSHMDYYCFSQQYEDYFEIARASRLNRVSFATSFLCGAVVQYWHQHKRRFEASDVSMTWAKFKDFLKKNLGDDPAFANSICSKFRQNSQYQAKSVLDWAAHLEHLQSILLEYNPVGAPTKPTMLRYFQKSLKPSVLAKLEYWDLELESFDQIVKNAIDVEAKLAFRPRSSTKKIDQNYPQGNRPAHSTIPKN